MEKRENERKRSIIEFDRKDVNKRSMQLKKRKSKKYFVNVEQL